MLKQLSAFIKPLIKPLLAATLAIVLVFGQVQSASAASGGRIGGGSFRTPSPSFSSPGRTYTSPGGGYGGGGYYPGGGFGYGYPFLIPSIGIGGFGGLFSILIFISIAGFLVRTLRSMQSGDSAYDSSASSTVSLTKLQVGLLSEARSLQEDLNRIAEVADTGSTTGLSQVLQETTLALLRHPEYWAYANGQIQQTNLLSAENQFNRLALSERSKFSAETLSNVDNLLRQAEARQALSAAGGELATLEKAPGEYIVVTLLVASQGKLQLPAINDTQDLRQAISQIGSVPGERLLALEVLWTPQASGDTLSADEVIAQYPELKLV